MKQGQDGHDQDFTLLGPLELYVMFGEYIVPQDISLVQLVNFFTVIATNTMCYVKVNLCTSPLTAIAATGIITQPRFLK